MIIGIFHARVHVVRHMVSIYMKKCFFPGMFCLKLYYSFISCIIKKTGCVGQVDIGGFLLYQMLASVTQLNYFVHSDILFVCIQFQYRYFRNDTYVIRHLSNGMLSVTYASSIDIYTKQQN